MRVLLDTQCWLWLQVSPERFSQSTMELLADTANVLLLSTASAWEIAIKYALDKLPLPEAPARYVPTRMERSGTTVLPIQLHHALHVAALPHHHRDPFDRMIIAQSQLEKIPVLSADPAFARYDVELWRP